MDCMCSAAKLRQRRSFNDCRAIISGMWVSEINGISFESSAPPFVFFKKVEQTVIRQITFRPCGLNVYDSLINNCVRYSNIFM